MKDENREKEILDSVMLGSVVPISILRALIQILSLIAWGFLFVIMLLGSILIYLHFSWYAVAGACLVGLGFIIISGIIERKARSYLSNIEHLLQKYERKKYGDKE